MTITSPFHARSTVDEVIAGHNLAGKTALVTGANSGLGLETTRALLSAHAEVTLQDHAECLWTLSQELTGFV